MVHTNAVVVLVHGTFAPDAAWTRSDSPMAKELTRAGMTPVAFQWSGHNSHHARDKAAHEFAAFLQELRKREPPGIAVVAHSHGGGIAARAVHDILPGGDNSISMVSLATPYFFAVSNSSAPGFVMALFLMISGFLSLLLPFLVVLTLIQGGGVQSWALWVGLLLVELVACVQVVGLVFWTKNHGPPWRSDARECFVKSVQAPDCTHHRLLVIRAADDEASSLLTLAQFSGLVSQTVLRMSRPQDLLTLLGWVSVASLLASLVGVGISGSLDELLPYLLASIGFFVFLVLSGPGIISLGQGFDGPTATLFSVISAEATPPGTYPVHQAQMRSGPHVKGRAHSSLYDDPDVIAMTIQHIADRSPTM